MKSCSSQIDISFLLCWFKKVRLSHQHRLFISCLLPCEGQLQYWFVHYEHDARLHDDDDCLLHHENEHDGVRLIQRPNYDRCLIRYCHKRGRYLHDINNDANSCSNAHLQTNLWVYVAQIHTCMQLNNEYQFCIDDLRILYTLNCFMYQETCKNPDS